MRILGFAGFSGGGKTTLVTALIPKLTERGIRVSTIKHAHHNFDVDKPGKDSHRHRMAGASEVLVSSGNRWALMHELRGEAEPTLDDLIERLTPVDLVLVEGFKQAAYDKIEVWRSDVGVELLSPGDPSIVALAYNGTRPAVAVPAFEQFDIAAIADFVVSHCGLTPLDRDRVR